MDKSIFEKMLEATTAARNEKVDLHEYVTSVSEMVGTKIKSILEQHQKDIMAVDEGLRAKIKENIRETLEKALEEVENYPKGMEL